MVQGDLERVFKRLRNNYNKSNKPSLPGFQDDANIPRLPILLRDPADEFVKKNQSWISRISRQVYRQSLISSSIASIARQKALQPLLGVSFGVSMLFSLGTLEGLLSVNDSVDFAEAARFSFHYATANVIPSFTWSTIDASIILQTLQPAPSDPSHFLYDFSALNQVISDHLPISEPVHSTTTATASHSEEAFRYAQLSALRYTFTFSVTLLISYYPHTSQHDCSFASL